MNNRQDIKVLIESMQEILMHGYADVDDPNERQGAYDGRDELLRESLQELKDLLFGKDHHEGEN